MAKATEQTNTNHAGSNVIDFASRKQARAAPTAHWFNHRSTGAPNVHPPSLFNHWFTLGAPPNVHSPSLFALPFVTLPPAGVTDWGEFWDQAKLWNDRPTGDACADYKRGRLYAEKSIKAIIDDSAIHHDLTLVMQRMIEGGFRRKGPGGRPCRSLASAEQGFIDALCHIAVEASRLVAANLAAGLG